MTVRVVVAGLATAVLLTCFTVLTVFFEAVVAVPVSAVASVGLVTVCTGAAESLADGVETVVGAVVDAAGGDVSVGTGWACCASRGVEDSARAAAIAGRALVRA